MMNLLHLCECVYLYNCQSLAFCFSLLCMFGRLYVDRGAVGGGCGLGLSLPTHLATLQLRVKAIAVALTAAIDKLLAGLTAGVIVPALLGLIARPFVCWFLTHICTDIHHGNRNQKGKKQKKGQGLAN